MKGKKQASKEKGINKQKKNVWKKPSAKKIGLELESEIIKLAKKYKYKVVSNAYIGFKDRLGKQRYTELDVVLLSNDGIIVIESKNYNGSIRGDLSDKYMRVVYPNKKEFTFYNPLIQNDTHIWSLSKFLEVDKEEITSTIVFSDNASLDFTNYSRLDTRNLIQLNELENKLKEIKERPKKISDYRVNCYYKKLKERTNVSASLKSRHIKQIKNNIKRKN